MFFFQTHVANPPCFKCKNPYIHHHSSLDLTRIKGDSIHGNIFKGVETVFSVEYFFLLPEVYLSVL